MFPATARLRPAYAATAYLVRRNGREVALRIGLPVPALRWGNWRQAWFVTAANPRSRLRTDGLNRRANRRLLDSMRRRGVWFAPVLARGDRGDWPAEEGLLVFGMARPAAAALGRQLRQNAILRVDRRRIALLPLN
jgi:hypothetical protein